MNTKMVVCAVAVSAACTFLLRALPFFAFSGSRKMPEWMEKLGHALPAAIMAVLIIYCLRDAGTDFVSKGIPELSAAALTAAFHKWKHNTLLSVLAGTCAYMLLICI